jgi:hypothetical protein
MCDSAARDLGINGAVDQKLFWDQWRGESLAGAMIQAHHHGGD